MAKSAFQKVENRYIEVDAQNPDLPTQGEYYCSGICKNGKRCMCPVSLIVPDEDGAFSRHFRRTKPNVRHGNECTHADKSLFQIVRHLDHSGKGMTDADILRIGQVNRQSAQKRNGNAAGKSADDIDPNDETVEEYRQQVQRLTKPRNIHQLYLILSDPETQMYAGKQRTKLIVNNQTHFYHLHNPGDGVMLVVAEQKFHADLASLSRKHCIVLQDAHFTPGPGHKRLTFVIEFKDDDLYQEIYTTCATATRTNYRQKYLLLGNWHYNTATCAYYTTLLSRGHFMVLAADQDVES